MLGLGQIVKRKTINNESSCTWSGLGQSTQKTTSTPHPMTLQKEKKQPPKTVYMEISNTFFPDPSS